MAEKSNIQWTDATFNPWRGCSKVSPGCAHCYADIQSKRNPRVLGVWGPQGTRVVAAESYWREPLRWDREAAAAGVRRRVFCASLADVFEGSETMPAGAVEAVVAARHRLLDLIARTPNLDWLLLTKRPGNVVRLWDEAATLREGLDDGPSLAMPLPNVWLGTSVEDQQRADERVPELLKVPAAVRFLSCEPLLGPVSLHSRRCRETGSCPACPLCLGGIHWVIVGGESGPDARPCRVEWVRDLVRQCRAAAVPCFVKQLGKRPTTTLPDGEAWPGHSGPTSPVQFQGDGFGHYLISGLTDRKGGDPAEWPEGLRVRELPTPVPIPTPAPIPAGVAPSLLDVADGEG